MTRTDLTITGDGSPLSARLDLPDADLRGYALLAHCFTCSKEQVAASRVACGLTARGIGVLRIDFTGLGSSGGEFADSTFAANIADLVRAADRLRADLAGPTLLVGHSLGGAAVLAAAAQIPEVRAVATIGAPYSPDHVAHLFGAALTGPESDQPTDPDANAEVRIGGRPFQVRRDFLAEIAGPSQHDRIAALGRPLLVLHSPTDEIVGVDNAAQIMEAATSAASLIVLDGADHLLTRPADADRVAAMIAAWASPYLEDATPKGDGAPRDSAPPEAGTVEVAETGAGRFTQRIRTANHEWAADEPESSGGSDTAPDPYALLLSALGACTSMTMRMYAERKGWDLRRATVTLTHDRLHAADCASCETNTGQLDRIVREIHLDGELDDAQREKLLAIADRCPVHRTLHAEIVVETDQV